MEQQTPIPPKSRMKPREGQKRAIFPSLIWGGRGGLGFPFILSKIVALQKYLIILNSICSIIYEHGLPVDDKQGF